MRTNRAYMLLTLLVLLGMTITAQAWDRGEVERFATLPLGEAYPEGICLGPDGNVYIVTVAANKPKGSPGTLLVFDPNGKYLRTVHIAGSRRMLVDLRFPPKTGNVRVRSYRVPSLRSKEWESDRDGLRGFQSARGRSADG